MVASNALKDDGMAITPAGELYVEGVTAGNVPASALKSDGIARKDDGTVYVIWTS